MLVIDHIVYLSRCLFDMVYIWHVGYLACLYMVRFLFGMLFICYIVYLETFLSGTLYIRHVFYLS